MSACRAGSGAISVSGMSATFCPTNASVGTRTTAGAAGAAAAGGLTGMGCCALAAQLNDIAASIATGICFTAGK